MKALLITIHESGYVERQTFSTCAEAFAYLSTMYIQEAMDNPNRFIATRIVSVELYAKRNSDSRVNYLGSHIASLRIDGNYIVYDEYIAKGDERNDDECD